MLLTVLTACIGSNDTLTEEDLPGIGALGFQTHDEGLVHNDVLATSEDGLNTPRDLEFNPEVPGELWIVNRTDDSTTLLHNAGTEDQWSEHLIDPFALHFMEEVSSIAFGQPGTFGTCQESRNTYNGQSSPNNFMGPSLWTSDLEIYAQSNEEAIDFLSDLFGQYVDLPDLRARAPDDRLALRWGEHLGTAEGYAAPTLAITEWVAPGSRIELGGRALRLLHTPGHTTDSVSLLDEERGLMFAGDFLYEGPLFAFLPNSSLGDYLRAAGAVLDAVPEDVRIYGAHRITPPGAPLLSAGDVRDLEAALEGIRAGERAGTGVYPVVYPVNERVELWAERPFLQRW